MENDKNLRVLVVFSDSSTNYLSTFIKDEWMVGMGYLPPNLLEDKTHHFYGKKLYEISELRETAFYYQEEDLTVKMVMDHFDKGQTSILLLN